MSHFSFLATEWPEVFEAAGRAEGMALGDARTACFEARRALELAVAWAYRFDSSLPRSYADNLSARLHEPRFKNLLGASVFQKARAIVLLGNRAVHEPRAVPPVDGLAAVRELFHVLYWLARTYARGERPAPGLTFDPARLPLPPAVVARRTAAQLQHLAAQLEERDRELAAAQAKNDALDLELQQFRVAVAAAKKVAEKLPDSHDYTEAETRDTFIDLLLREAGWNLVAPRDREFPVTGLPDGDGRVDYVLWGDDGRPLALVEAKRTRKDARAGQQQGRYYADALERDFGQRPAIFLTNGYDHHLWDDADYPPRPVQGFYKKAELEYLHYQRAHRKSLRTLALDDSIIDRPYQQRAVRKVAESFEDKKQRKALLVMATGAGKTRVVVALCKLLIEAGWTKRILFLADRRELVKQAVGAFREFLPHSTTVNALDSDDIDGQVLVSTYPTMMGLLEDHVSGERRLGTGHFDLVILDEAHRSVFKRYGAILEYFDSFLVGLTATPKDEVDRNTYRLFDLEAGVPTDAYPLEEAVAKGYLVPPRAVTARLKFPSEGIKYEELSEDDKDAWDDLDWGETGAAPAEVGADAVNRWLFNADTVDKVLEHLMTRGLKVAGGDRLGKTIVFAKNQAHARFIAERFDHHYPHYKSTFARVITEDVVGAEKLLENFKQPNEEPHVAISVDMLDTGVDVHEIVNLVFFRPVHSRTKFWQMIGRGTRKCANLFGPGQDKEFFYLFDYCGNLEFFSQHPEVSEGDGGQPLGQRLFTQRLALLAELDRRGAAGELGEVSEPEAEPADDDAVRKATAALLWSEVAAMNLANFVVRPKRRLVEKYGQAEAWGKLSAEALDELAKEVAGLPSALAAEPEEAKRFDLLILRLQLTKLRGSPAFAGLETQLREIAEGLEAKATIPDVLKQIELIEEIQTDEWWLTVTVARLETVRRRLRGLVQFVERQRRKGLYTDFEDEMGPEAEFELPGLGGQDFAKFKQKARAF
ncbi:MAG: DEAD/DEAH box helicase family protein, partial [Thermoanaerobaculia bacterium]|nr:DEAD/DEAH box helicase family protein [Thermoanaerobaculia bacterium]